MKNLNSKLFYSLTGAAAVASLPSCAPKQAEPQGPYNIVYIMTDDHTAQMMSCYDRRYVHTPNLDRIAEDGVRFTNSFVANSLSGPSRACMITGKHSHANGFADNEPGTVFDNTQQTFPKLLQAAGYQTAVVGKWHLKSVPTGFDYWEVIPGQGDYYNPEFINMDGSRTQHKGYMTNIVTDKAIDWMENKRDKNRPFLLFIHHKACHRNWLPELKYLSLYEDKTFPIPETFYDDYEGRPAAKAQEMSIASNHDMDLAYDVKVMDANVTTRLTPNYLSMIGRLDSHERAIYDQFYDSIAIDFRARKLSVSQNRSALYAHTNSLLNNGLCLRWSHCNALNASAVFFGKHQRCLNAVQIVRVDFTLYSVTLEHACNGIHLNVAGSGNLLDTYDNLHKYLLTCLKSG